mgnify:CR=1 FL=1
MTDVGEINTIYIKVKEVQRFKDGGTIEYIDEKGIHYFRDNRLGTSTINAIFDRYPSLDGSGILENYQLIIVTEFN